MKRKYLKILIIVGLIILVFVLDVYLTHPSVLQTPSLSKGGENSDTINTNLLQPSFVKVEVNTGKESQIESKALSEKNIKVSLVLLDKVYAISLEEGSTVYDAMVRIKKENNFDFKYKEYPSLGIFIDEINGIKGTSGKYWIYYVNNIEASVGVSNYILKDGDSILWKQE